MLVSTPRKVLLVEDDKIIQQIHTHFLRKLGFEIDLVSTGEAALAALDNINKQANYFAVVLDLGLPVITGEMVLSEIRAKEEKTGKHLPVIIVTAHADPNEFLKYRKQKADIFIKPVSLSQFEQALQKWQTTT